MYPVSAQICMRIDFELLAGLHEVFGMAPKTTRFLQRDHTVANKQPAGTSRLHKPPGYEMAATAARSAPIEVG
jgi:hypothetical protein